MRDARSRATARAIVLSSGIVAAALALASRERCGGALPSRAGRRAGVFGPGHPRAEPADDGRRRRRRDAPAFRQPARDRAHLAGSPGKGAAHALVADVPAHERRRSGNRLGARARRRLDHRRRVPARLPDRRRGHARRASLPAGHDGAAGDRGRRRLRPDAFPRHRPVPGIRRPEKRLRRALDGVRAPSGGNLADRRGACAARPC